MYQNGTKRLARLVAGTSALAAIAAGGVAQAQDSLPPGPEPAGERPSQPQDAVASEAEVIVVTAQRQAQSLQNVPIAVSAFSSEALEAQQIENPADLQLALPNVTFTKTNFTTSSFTIRGIGDLCTGVNCDQATAIHLDGTPLLQTRLFETEFFDLERLEVLRGPQGTLFGRNATSGVVNFIPARPDLNGFSAAIEAEYGNYDAIEAKAMVNLPSLETIGVRLAGFYQNRDGYTNNLFDGRRIDDRDVYAIRGMLRFEPTDTTTIDLLASYTRENDNRLRIQKQQCQRDPTGVLGCLNSRRDFGTVNLNATIFSTLTSRELFAAVGIPSTFALGEHLWFGRLRHGGQPRRQAPGGERFHPDLLLRRGAVPGPPRAGAGLAQAAADRVLSQGAGRLAAGLYPRGAEPRRVHARPDGACRAAAGAIPGLPRAYFAPIASALIPNGPAGNLCTSLPEETGTGVYGAHALCTATPQDFDRSVQSSKDWSVEGILTSDFDGPFNFLLGAIYVDLKLDENSYYVNGFPLDYASGIVGTFSALARAPLAGPPFGATPIPPSYLATPFFRNHTDEFTLKSYGIFGELYWDVADRVKLTLGARYNNDKKPCGRARRLAIFWCRSVRPTPSRRPCCSDTRSPVRR